jgi:hypothetical protein
MTTDADNLCFKTLAEAEQYLTSQGFRLMPNSCHWQNPAGDEAGCYVTVPEDAVASFRVEINRAKA